MIEKAIDKAKSAPIKQLVFEAVFLGFIKIFHQHHLKFNWAATDVTARKFLEDFFKQMLSGVEVAEVEERVGQDEFVSVITLDHIVLECAILIAEKGELSVHFVEVLNCLRANIIDFIEKWGICHNIGDLRLAQSRWGSYRLWATLAEKCQIGPDEIQRFRQWSQENNGYYES